MNKIVPAECSGKSWTTICVNFYEKRRLQDLKDQIPKRSKESVREFIKKIVEEINKLLEQDIRRAVTAAVNKEETFPYSICVGNGF